MNQHLQNILNSIQLDKKLSEEEKNAIIKALKDADKEFEITNFKLDRTEKVKRTTAILLEETIEELENKRKSIEAQNRELEIEASLERVRAVAMSMMKADDLLNICKTQYSELLQLGFTDIRNALIGIYHDEESYFSDYDYSDFSGGNAHKIPYNKNSVVDSSLTQMKSATDAFTEFVVKGKELEEWKIFRKQNGEYDDTRIDAANVLYYYFYSIKKGYIGMSTFKKISDDQLSTLKRFRNVFDLAYRRYEDITNAAAQAHEAKIEASLERMRAAAMSMQKSDEIIHVSESMYKELTALGFTNIRNAQIAIQNEAKQAYTVFEFSDFAAGKGEAAYNSSHITQELYNELGKTKDAFYQKEFSGKEFEEWRKWRKALPVSSDSRIDRAKSVCFYLYSFGTGHLGISTFNPITEAQIEILKRFKKVFELSYQRYTDVAKAEAQSKEAKIELALERVRARTMAMQKSDELGETAYVLFQQFEELGEDPEQIGIGIMNEEEKIMELWSTINGKMRDHVVEVSLDEPVLMRKLYAAYRAGEKSLVVDMNGKDLEDYNNYRNSIADIKIDISRTKNRRVVSVAYFSKGIISLATPEPRSGETIQLLERFANVFDLTYTRFLDLKNAEAQTKESQIQLALERVRARTMAMQQSNELPDAANILFQQVQSLGMSAWSAGYCIWDEDKKAITLWMSSAGIIQQPFRAPVTEDPSFIHFFEAYQRGETFYVEEIGGDELVSHYKYMRKLPVVGDMLNKFVEDGGSLPSFQIFHLAFFSQGFLLFITYEQVPEAHDIFNRFGKVFEQTYTRFLDLQKAEAQAREAQIETALERVRSRSMGMQKSEELKEVIKIIYQQLTHLKIYLKHAGFVVDYTPKGDWHFWITDEQDIPSKITHPYFESVWANQFNETKKKGSELFATHLNFEEKNKFYHELLSYIPGLPEASKDFYLSCPGLAASTVVLDNVGLYIENFEGIPYTVEENNTLIRFGKVFQQTYTRFLDLQKAEAQTREAQIETALERVRSRTMAMQKSDELAETASLLFKQISDLGIQTWTSGFNIWEKDDTSFIGYNPTPSGEIAAPYHIPSTEDSFFINIHETKKRGEDFLVFESLGDSLAETYKYMKTLPVVKEVLKGIEDSGFHLPSFQINHCAYFSQGFLLFITLEAYPEAHDIFKRFAKVFEQTYTRFLDLQKAEAQSRESQIQLALERARSQSMIMQHSNELDDTLRVFHEQVLLLGINSAFSFLWLPDEKNDKHIFWAAWKENENDLTVFKSKAINYPLDRNEPATAQCLIDWKGNDPIVSYHVPPSGVVNYFAAWQELIDGVEQLKPEYFSGGLYYVEAFMKYGCFGVIVTNDLVEDEKKILGRFAIEFERTYRRFLDLQKAEAQSREAQIEASLERVRTKAMSMHKSEDLHAAVAIVFEELEKLNIGVLRCGISVLNKEKRCGKVWLTSTDRGQAVQVTGDEPFDIHPLLQGAFEAWLKQEDFYYVLEGEDLVNYYKAVKTAEFMLPESQLLISDTNSKQYCFVAVYNSGGLFAFQETAFTEEAKKIMRRFAAVFDLTYKRFLDLQKAEAQAKEAQVETALERVRSRTLAMQRSDELAETAAVLFRQLINLGIAPNRLYIGIIKDDNGHIEFWVTDEDGSKINTQFTGDANRNASMKKMYAAWKEQKKSLTIDMQGKELNDYFHYLGEEMHVPFKGGLEQKRRVQNIAYFGKGMIGIASPEPQPDETVSLLERFASVFNLTYTRFNDLKGAEAHAIQAEEDLIKLQTEKKRAEDALTELRSTQTQLIQSEKMASLGELTAGIAHEIQNPLNFVNNFSEVSVELIREMVEEVDKGNAEEVKAIADDLVQNLEKINHHGKRADAIVKGMLQHSRSSSSTKEPTDINKLADEYLRLAYHGLRAKEKSFNATLKTDYDETIGNISIIPQDIGRVILNLITNAFYVVGEKKKLNLEGYEPIVKVSTKKQNDIIKVKVTDNGNGIPKNILDKIFQPFFTTKPTGQGTGLGLSLAYDIVKAHGGELKVETKENEGSVFMIQLPII